MSKTVPCLLAAVVTLSAVSQVRGQDSFDDQARRAKLGAIAHHDNDDILSAEEGLLLISALSAIVVSLLTFTLF